MAALNQPHWHTITTGLRDLLTLLGRQPYIRRFYLAGGTALALQMGHRRSVDLDFFSDADPVSAATRQEIIRSFQAAGAKVIENVEGNLLLPVNDIHVGFFSYGYPLVQETVELGAICLASIIDIGLMKCDELISRGSRKDFYDVFFISRRIPLVDLLAFSEQKYAYYRDFPLTVIEHMVAFDNADRDVQPELFDDVPWQQVKDFFVREARRLGGVWLQPDQ